MIGGMVMLRPAIRRVLARISVALLLVLLYAALAFSSTRARFAEEVLNGTPPLTAEPAAANLVLFGVVAVAAASAAIAVRMVCHWH